MSNIALDLDSLNQLIAGLKQAGENFEERRLVPIDLRSTISANANTRQAFQEAQSAHQVLGAALVASSSDIDGICERFLAIDTDASNWEVI